MHITIKVLVREHVYRYQTEGGAEITVDFPEGIPIESIPQKFTLTPELIIGLYALALQDHKNKLAEAAQKESETKE